MLDARTSASLVPVQCPRGRVRRPQWTPRSDSLPDTACPVVSRRTPSPPPGTPWRTRSDADRGTDERHGGTRTPSIATTPKTACRDTPSPLLWGRRLRLSNQGWLGDGNTASATETTAATKSLLGVALSSKPRLGALLS